MPNWQHSAPNPEKAFRPVPAFQPASADFQTIPERVCSADNAGFGASVFRLVGSAGNTHSGYRGSLDPSAVGSTDNAENFSAEGCVSQPLQSDVGNTENADFEA